MSEIKTIKKGQILHKTIVVVFYLTVFFLPANLFRVFLIPEAYLSGVLIDYWAPKLYASSLLVWLLWCLRLAELYQKRSSPLKIRASLMPYFRSFSKRPHHLVVLIIAGILVLGRLPFTALPIVSIAWLLSSLAGPGLFLLYLIHNQKIVRRHLGSAVLLSVSAQAILAGYQFLRQEPLFPYWVMGEPRFRASSFLAKSEVFAIIRALPYGSTPHPNILGGWMLVGMLAIKYLKKYSYMGIFISTLFFFTLLASESMTSIVSLALLIVVIAERKRLSSLLQQASLGRFRLATPIVTAVAGVFLWQIGVFLLSLHFDSPSISRRLALLVAWWNDRKDWFVWGAGSLQHIRTSIEAHIGLSQGRFLQPVHSALLVWLSDLGLWTTLLLYAFFISEYYLYSFIVLLSLVIFPIFSLDHFAVTTISGQYLLILFIYFFKNVITDESPVSCETGQKKRAVKKSADKKPKY